MKSSTKHNCMKLDMFCQAILIQYESECDFTINDNNKTKEEKIKTLMEEYKYALHTISAYVSYEAEDDPKFLNVSLEKYNKQINKIKAKYKV